MKRLFGAAKAEAPAGPAPSLTETSQKMDQRVQDLDSKIARCEEDLRKYMSAKSGPQKALAMQCLKRKKMYEQQRDQLLGTQFNIDALAGAQEQAELTVTTVEAMKAGQADLKQRYAQLGGAMDIERLMDGMADLSDEIADINEALSTSFAVPDGFDEASFEDEFNALEEEMTMEKLAGITSSSRPSYLPAQPATEAATPAAPEISAEASTEGAVPTR